MCKMCTLLGGGSSVYYNQQLVLSEYCRCIVGDPDNSKVLFAKGHGCLEGNLYNRLSVTSLGYED